MDYLTGNFYHLVDKGKVRATNEDSAISVVNCYGNVLLAVADGMGGANKGEYASEKLLKHIEEEFIGLEKELQKPKQLMDWLYKVINAANHKIYNKAKENKEYEGMGTTLSLCLIVKNILITAQVGDSRIYLIKDKKLEQISVDQTYATYLVHDKKIDPAQARVHKNRHMLTNAIGTKKDASVDIQSYDYNKESILLCSDGLYNNVPPLVMESILRGNDTPERKCNQLIAFGNNNGGSDNMAVVIWESR